MEQAIGAGLGTVSAILIIVVIGAIVGWIASLVVKGTGSGLFVDILVGIGGSAIAGFLAPKLGISLGGGIVGAIIPAVIGAIILLLIIKMIRRV